MITREYFAHVVVYKKGSEGREGSEHNFVMVYRSWRKPCASDLADEAIEYAPSLSDYQDSVGGVIVKSLTRVR